MLNGPRDGKMLASLWKAFGKEGMIKRQILFLCLMLTTTTAKVAAATASSSNPAKEGKISVISSNLCQDPKN